MSIHRGPLWAVGRSSPRPTDSRVGPVQLVGPGGAPHRPRPSPCASKMSLSLSVSLSVSLSLCLILSLPPFLSLPAAGVCIPSHVSTALRVSVDQRSTARTALEATCALNPASSAQHAGPARRPRTPALCAHTSRPATPHVHASPLSAPCTPPVQRASTPQPRPTYESPPCIAGSNGCGPGTGAGRVRVRRTSSVSASSEMDDA
jgi:hypothetical protein